MDAHRGLLITALKVERLQGMLPKPIYAKRKGKGSMVRLKTLISVCCMVLFMISISFALQADSDNGSASQKKVTDCIVTIKEESSSSAIQLFGIIAGTLAIIWQINRQHKNNLKLQKENYKDKIKLEIYQVLGSKIRVANNKCTKLNTYIKFAPVSLELYVNSVSHGVKVKPVEERAEVFSELYFSLCDSIVDLVTILEEYEIASPSLRVFRMAILSSNHDLAEMQKKLHNEFLKCLPIDILEKDREKIGTDVIIPCIPKVDEINNLKKLSSEFDEKAMDLTCYLFDLQVEAQNALLGGVFDHRVQSRRPIDSRYVVIKSDPDSLEKLERYFLEETDWGKVWQEAQSSCREKVKTKMA